LQRALDLQRAAGEEDAPTVDALAQSLVRSDEFERALPLLTVATSRPNATPMQLCFIIAASPNIARASRPTPSVPSTRR
jgi:hypothetical protein